MADVPQTFGIDCSKWQTNIHWDKVAAAGIQFVYIKASESRFADMRFSKHWAGAQSAGLPKGAYHFYRQAMDPQKQIDIYLKTLGDDPGELPPVLDIEDTSSLNNAQMLKGCKLWLETVADKLQRQPMIYTAKWYWDGNCLVGGKYPEWAAQYPLWVAQYPFPNGAPTAAQLKTLKPKVPKSWRKWAVWQYSEKGVVDGNFKESGALANTDLNLFNGPVENLLKLATGEPVPMTDAETGLVSFSAGLGEMPTLTNQNVINAFHWAFAGQFINVMGRAGQLDILNDREAPYQGPAMKLLPNLTDAEKKILQEKYDAIMAKQ